MTLRSLLAALTLSLTLPLSGCGPGTGGTGGGESEVFLTFTATTTSVCVSALGNSLDCGVGDQVVIDMLPGSGQVLLADVAGGYNTSAIILSNHIDLVARCAGLSFSGDWGVQSVTGNGRYWGLVQLGQHQPQYASLSLQAAADGAVVAQLRDVDERTLLGPVLLSRMAPLLPPPRPCPGMLDALVAPRKP